MPLKIKDKILGNSDQESLNVKLYRVKSELNEKIEKLNRKIEKLSEEIKENTKKMESNIKKILDKLEKWFVIM